MQVEWIIFLIVIALTSMLINFLKMRREAYPKLSAERYAELTALLIDEEVIREQLRWGNKINAIKSYRIQTGTGLKEAKDAVEMMEQEMRRARMAELIEANRGMDGVMNRLLIGDKINAIKIYRKETGVGLKEAKDAVEGMMVGLKASRTAGSDQAGERYVDPAELQHLISAGKRLQAIKYYRETTGVGLKEAKDAVDALTARMHQNIES